MRRAELAISHPRAHSAEHDREAIIGDVDLDLFEGPSSQEGTRSANKRKETSVRQPRAHSNHVLLGDAHIDEPVRKKLLKPSEIARTDAVVADSDDPLIGLRKLDQCFREGDAAIEGRRRFVGSSVHQASSFSASSTCSGDGTL
jgi:hypothetical protein